MKSITKRSVSIVLSLILCFSVVFGANLSVSAATVDYVYAEGRFIKNWGTREEVATFLSPNAEEFYKDNNTTYEKLSALKGAAQNDVRSTALYKELNNLMKKNHTYITDYGYTRYKFQYTDIENSGKTSNRISSFYSGNPIGPTWDSGDTWNREHTWPDSKGEGQGENDIMMLRPTAKRENGSRSNKAYGKGGSYYNPNSESGGKHDLRGDVARIVLYQHVRWEQTKLFGTSGVIESRAVLLEWMEADPVDTWELGRNDAVESITGTRNVFVDYPELAFILFGEQVPTNYQTPSGKAKGGTTQTPTPDNTQNNNSSNNTQSNTQSSNQNSNQNTTTSKPSNNQTTSKPTTSTPANTSCKHANTQSVAAEEPRCDMEGYTEGKYCNDCKTYISGHKVVEATGHTYAGDCDADCDTCSAERATPTDHVYDETNVCTVCGLSKENTENKDDSETTIGAVDKDNDQTTDEEESDGIGTIWWIVIIVAAIAAAAGTTFVIVYFTKKQVNKQ